MKKRLLALALVVSLCATALPVHAAQFGLSDDRAEIPVTDSSCLPSAEDNAAPVVSEQDVTDQLSASTPLPADDSAAPAARERDVSAQLSASTSIASGACGTNGAAWTLYSDGLLRISGTGDMTAYTSASNAPWYSYRSQITSVQLEEGVTSISMNAFNNYPQLTTVSIANSVVTIGPGAFANCSALTAVTLSNSLSTIPASCFSNCTALTSLVLPDNVATISTSAFQGCSQLKTVSVGSGLSRCERKAFYGCTSLEGVYLSSPDTFWYSITFDSNTANPLTLAHHLYLDGKLVTDLVIPDSVTTLKEYTFSGLAELTTLTIGTSLTSVAQNAFAGCTNISDVLYSGPDRTGLDIGTSGNTALTDAYWHYNFDGGPLVTLTAASSEEGTLQLPRRALPGETISIVPAPAPGYRLVAITADAGTVGDDLSYTVPQGVTSQVITFTASFELIDPDRSITDGGSCGSSLNWTLYTDGLLLLSGHGEMGQYSKPSEVPWHQYRDQITSVRIDDGVLSVGPYTFSQCPYLTSVTIPASVTTIGDSAFSNCVNLGRAEFLGSAPGMEANAFFKNQKLPDPGAFCIYYHGGEGWDALISTPEGQTAPKTWMGYYIDCVEAEPITDFSTLDENKRNSQGILFTLDPDSLTARAGDNSAIPNNSGYYGSNNGVVTIPATVKAVDGTEYRVDNVGQMAFASNKTVREVLLGEHVQGLAPSSFQDASNLALVTPSKANTTYRAVDGVLYHIDGTILYVYPAKKEGATFTVPDTVQTVVSNAFRSNPFLEEVIVPDNVLSIGPEAFCNCRSLSKLTLPFIGCSALDSFPFPRLFSEDDKYSAVPATLKEVVITKEELCKNAFLGCSGIRRITLPSCHTVPASSFQNCSSLVSLRFADSDLPYADGVLQLPKSTSEIGDSAFFGCVGLTDAIFAEGLTSIGRQTFRKCTALTSVTMPEGLQTIGDYAFYECGALVTATLPNTVTTIGSSAFAYCGLLPSIVIPDSVTTIGNSAFSYCTSAESVTIGRGLTKLGGKQVFNMCRKVRSFEVDKANASFTSDRWGVLFTKNMSTLLNYPASRSLPYYSVPRATTLVSSYAFQQHFYLKNLYVPASVDTFEKDAFERNTGTTYCVYQGSPADAYVVSQTLYPWYMDGRVPNEIEVKGLPDCAALPLDSNELEGLYLVANYNGTVLPMDEYEISFAEAEPSGYQVATVTCQGLKATFEVLRYDAEKYTPLCFGPLDQDLKDDEKFTRFAALYQDGKMLSAYTPLVINGKLLVRADKGHAETQDKAALFQLDAKTFAPVALPTPLPTTP